MKRLLIFCFVFPAIATVAFYAVLFILTGAMVDSLSGPAFVYLLCMGPGLAIAAVDWLMSRTPVPAVVGTTLIAYGAAIGLLMLDGSVKSVFALALITAIPAAICSTLVRAQGA